MRNKILKLVLNKNCSKKLVILDKKDGNITSLLAGLMFLMIVIILVMFNFRVTMLSEVFYNIDDALTASTLGAATPNTDAYMGAFEYDSAGNIKLDAFGKPKYDINDVEEGQLVLQDTLTSSLVNYKQTKINEVSVGNTTETIDGNKKYNEQKIVRSELNSNLINNGRYDAATVSNPNNISSQSDAAALKRLGYTSAYNSSDEYASYINYKNTTRNIDSTEAYTLKAVNNLLDVTYTNFTQSLVAAPKVISLTNVADNFCIKKDSVLDKAFLGNYLSSDITITRLEIYDLYRYTLAERHVYASPYMTYTVTFDGVTLGSNYTWDGYNMDGTESTAPKITLSKPIILDDGTEISATNAVRDMINNTAMGSSGKTTGIDISTYIGWNGPTTESDFRELMSELYPAMIVPDKEPEWFKLANPGLNYDTDPYNPEYDMYNLMKGLWKTDLEAWDNRDSYPLVFWEDTGITCQTSWWDNGNYLKYSYGYLWNNSSQNVIKITDNILTTDASGRLLLPIEGYAVYGYVADKSITTQYNNFSELVDSTNGTLSRKVDRVILGDFNADGSIEDKSSTGKIYENRKKDAEICYTGVYMEVTFDVVMFPNNSTDPNSTDSFLNLAAFSTQPVTQARLVTITKND